MPLVELLKRWFGRFGRKPIGHSAAMPAETTLPGVLRMVEHTQPVEYGCDEVYALLDQYAEQVASGGVARAAELMPLVRQHLDMCPDCREEYEALLAVLRSAAA